MSTTAAPNLTHVSDHYDPDEVLPQNSPCLQPIRPKLHLSPSPEPIIPDPTVSPPPSFGTKKSNRRMKVKPSQGDAVLVGFLDGGRQPEIAIIAGRQPLPSDTEAEDHYCSSDSDSDSSDGGAAPRALHIGGRRGKGKGKGKGGGWGRGRGGVVDVDVDVDVDVEDRVRKDGPERKGLPSDPAGDTAMGGLGLDFKSLAAGALGLMVDDPAAQPELVKVESMSLDVDKKEAEDKVPLGLAPPANATKREEHGRDGWPPPVTLPPFSPRSICSPQEQGAILAPPMMDMRSPPNGISPSSHSEGLPPIQMLGSPRSETNGQTSLPSLKSTLGDINQLTQNANKEQSRGSHTSYPQSPPGTLPRLPIMHASPPVSPADPFRSVHSYYYPTSSLHRSPVDYASSATETPGSDHSVASSTPATSASIADRMSIDGLTNHQGTYVCKFDGCSAAPFQTQYLLNSHANVHSSARPHYCPVAGCPRSEGGKGFKRKNEMIRHGLVHDSPGYVCPFCPDREHKYPRPDNLQRHVRVHHVDKDKDDPALRDVLAQRPDGPSRGRRRRGGPN
ncbi:hypothetical protein B0T22DRAFT_484662 [Podospora appendiculata]|uniref:C2H2-type domain-containing protein n=1 Tax=Podospora appendiculata TaxID=314037 RepID=A0AAE1C8C9_9PEZI|nr:hypothetical protein B0T22DRAFT_484662 [Podospora appendiculata]